MADAWARLPGSPFLAALVARNDHPITPNLLPARFAALLHPHLDAIAALRVFLTLSDLRDRRRARLDLSRARPLALASVRRVAAALGIDADPRVRQPGTDPRALVRRFRGRIHDDDSQSDRRRPRAPRDLDVRILPPRARACVRPRVLRAGRRGRRARLHRTPAIATLASRFRLPPSGWPGSREAVRQPGRCSTTSPVRGSTGCCGRSRRSPPRDTSDSATSSCSDVSSRPSRCARQSTTSSIDTPST